MKSVLAFLALAISTSAYAYDDHDRAHQSFIESMDRQREIQAQENIADELRRSNDLNEQSQRNNDGNPFNGGALQGDGGSLTGGGIRIP